MLPFLNIGSIKSQHFWRYFMVSAWQSVDIAHPWSDQIKVYSKSEELLIYCFQFHESRRYESFSLWSVFSCPGSSLPTLGQSVGLSDNDNEDNDNVDNDKKFNADNDNDDNKNKDNKNEDNDNNDNNN